METVLGKNTDAPEITIGQRKIGINYPCFIIAEAGTSHQGDIKKGYALIDAASDAGADCVKFQIVFADEIVHPKTGLVSLPGGNIPIYNCFKKLEQNADFFKKLKLYAEDKGLVFLCTPFGKKSIKILQDMKVDAIKIASPELNYFDLLREISPDIPAILSTGVSTLGDIEKAIKVTGKNISLLHCVTSYPAPEEEYNLKVIPLLSRIFGVAAGVSDHSSDPVLVPVLSILCGGCIIEKHLTLSNKGKGLDDPVAVTPAGFKKMVLSVRKAESMNSRKTIKWLSTDYSEQKIDAVLGCGIKTLAPSESENYTTTNRSILALVDLPKGTAITRENTAVLRSEKNLLPGLSPDFMKIIKGKKVIRDVNSGSGITWNDFF